MSYQVIDNRPASPTLLLIDNVAWGIIAAITVSNLGVSSIYVDPDVTYLDFLEILSVLKSQTLTTKLVVVDQEALTLLPLISQAYNNNEIPETTHFKLQAMVEGFGGNAHVNKVNFTDSMLETISPASLSQATSMTLTITFA